MENTELYESREQAPWNHNGTQEIVDNWEDRDGDPDEGQGCPQCGSDEATELGKLGTILWLRCRDCGTIFQGESADVDEEE